MATFSRVFAEVFASRRSGSLFVGSINEGMYVAACGASKPRVRGDFDERCYAALLISITQSPSKDNQA